MSKHELLILFVVALPMVGAVDVPSRSGGLLIVANKGDQTVGIIDPEAGREIATIKETGFTAHEVIASPTAEPSTRRFTETPA